MTLEQARNNIGNNVTYHPFVGCKAKDCEYGVITRVNDRYVFVRYGSDRHSKATNQSDLTLG